MWHLTEIHMHAKSLCQHSRCCNLKTGRVPWVRTGLYLPGDADGVGAAWVWGAGILWDALVVRVFATTNFLHDVPSHALAIMDRRGIEFFCHVFILLRKPRLVKSKILQQAAKALLRGLLNKLWEMGEPTVPRKQRTWNTWLVNSSAS